MDQEALNRVHKSFIHSRQEGGSKTNPILHDTNFVEICKDMGFDPKYQFQLSLIMKVEEQIMEEAIQKSRTVQIRKKIMLSNTQLRKYP